MIALREAHFEQKHLGFKHLDSGSLNKGVPNYCGECFRPIEAALDRDSREHFSKDMFCQCGRGR
jgi:hypothetical protein